MFGIFILVMEIGVSSIQKKMSKDLLLFLVFYQLMEQIVFDNLDDKNKVATKKHQPAK